jgi:hypothetical protein
MRPSIFGTEPRDPTGPLNNSRNVPAAPIPGPDGKLWCPGRNADGTICRAILHKTRTPERCPECLQALEPAGHVQDADLAAAGVKP